MNPLCGDKTQEISGKKRLWKKKGLRKEKAGSGRRRDEKKFHLDNGKGD